MAASLDRAAFYAAVRVSLFSGRLTASQVAGMDAILDAAPALLGTTSLGYGCATTFHECARTMQPIEEYGRGKGRAYGPTGFWGRGFVQLTWETNYAKATARLRALGILTPAEDLVKTPRLAMRLDVAAAILWYGMVEGWFTGKKLSDYFGGGRYDRVKARRIINGSDKAATVARYCDHFVDALRAAGHSVIPVGEPSNSSPISSTAKPLPGKGSSAALAQSVKSRAKVGQPAPSGGLSSAPVDPSAPQGLLARILSRLRTAYPVEPEKG